MQVRGKKSVNRAADINFRIPCLHRNLPARDEEELRRLFYVALTRAEIHLIISYAKYKTDGKEMEPSMFIAEILEQHLMPVEKVALRRNS